jgi:plastocyanin
MKKTLLFIAGLTLTSGALFATQFTITNSGYTFSPDYVEINPGDTVNFVLGSIHDAVEVTQETWNANENTPNGGFTVPFGGGAITLSSVGIHYYVCEPHASLGMKGRINVLGPADLPSLVKAINKFNVYPNPASNFFTVEYSLNSAGSVSIKLTDITGREIANVFQDKQSAGHHQLTYSLSNALNPGLYLIEISYGEQNSVQKLVIQ